MSRLANSRFNPKPGIKDFWNEFRKPNPFRWPILIASTLPFAVIFYWLSNETVYRTPDRPSITYITTFDPDRTDEEIAASNLENQEVKDLREQAEADLAERKRELYKALGAAAGMDVEEIEARAEAERAEAEAQAQAERDAMFGRSADAGEAADDGAGEEGSTP
ncbi:hypothetical protein [uncultured Erythrobacter sp.]|uniref:hypothetical protein n=1 Tax=uncultured Erythrobacter sp. TaxID=263913 RepID=UPI0026089EC2|nr:hypothetical protein [uncultured Erythrobacter sp.]